MSFRINLPISGKKRKEEMAIGILVQIALNLQINLQSIAILTILSLPVYKHEMSFHLFKSLITFDNISYLSAYKTCTALVKFIPKHFILSAAAVNGIVLLRPLKKPSCLFPDLREKTFSVSPVSMMFAVGFQRCYL